jgi:hypothetical protein
VNSTAEAQSQLDQRLQKTFDYAIDVTKQLLTLGSAILALTLTVAKEAPNGTRGFMLAGWGAFLLSVIFGIVSLYTLIREFAPTGDGSDAPSIRSWRVRGPLLLQIVTFALGAVFVVAYAYSVWKKL